MAEAAKRGRRTRPAPWEMQAGWRWVNSTRKDQGRVSCSQTDPAGMDGGAISKPGDSSPAAPRSRPTKLLSGAKESLLLH